MEHEVESGPVKVEVFAIGTELVMGRIYDTNSFWIAEQLAKLGDWPRRITCLADDDADVIAAFADSMQRGTQVIITTGGLGPTPDDRTLDCVSQLLGLKLEVRPETIESFVQRRNLTDASQLSEGLRKMAVAPVGARVYQNPAGWAPLIVVDAGPTTFYLMPGPPREVQGIWSVHLNDLLKNVFRTATVARRVWVTMYESEVSPHLQQVMQTYPRTYLKAYVALRTETSLPIDLVAHGPDEAAAQVVLEAAQALLTELVVTRGKELRIEE